MRRGHTLGIVLLMTHLVACRQDAGGGRDDRPLSSLALTAQQCEAIHAAETFIRENGYTETPATSDRSMIRWELLDDPAQIERVLALRHDTLKPHAYGLRSGIPGDPLGWTVLFEYTERVLEVVKLAEGKPRDQPGGAVVLVKLGGGTPVVVKQHTPIRLSAVARLPSVGEVSATCAAVQRKK